MPETLFHRDFSSGWCPSDDPVNGRPNCLLQMDNLQLDHNGALSLIGGTNLLNPPYPAAAHTLYSVYIGGSRKDYAALSDGSVYRDNVQIITGGDNSNAAFNTAFNFTLICSGPKRYKDNGATLTNLGVLPPNTYPRAVFGITDAYTCKIGNMQAGLVNITGGITIIGGGQYIQVVTNPTGVVAFQTYYSTPPGDYPFNDNILTGPPGTSYGTDDDIFVLNGYTPNPFGMSLQFDVLLVPPDAAGDQTTDYFSLAIKDLASQVEFDTVTGAFTVKAKRSDFLRVGSNAYDWSKIYGYRLTINNNTGATASTINIWGFSMGNPWFEFRGGSNALVGTYRYLQVNVNNTGSYLAKSIAGPPSPPYQIETLNPQIVCQDPTSIDSQVNEVWIYRSGGNLGGNWYRVLVIKPLYPAVYDTMSDQAALELNIKLNVNLVSIAAATISDKIFDILGPIQGRYYYFTTNFMYPSDVNNPDLVDASLAIRTCGSQSELYMWARTVSSSVVIVGTSLDAYLLTGTFATFPDNTIDIYYQSLGLKFPPITYDAVSYGGTVYYLGTDGWRSVQPTSFGSTYANQNNQLIVSPNLDRLYKGEICNGYQPPTLINNPGTVRYPITIGKNRIYCFPAGTGRAEIYDFLRQHWRTSNYNLGDASATTTTQDSKILVFYKGDNRLREIETVQKLVDGTTKQFFNLLFPYKDSGTPRQRKDTYTFKTRCYTEIDYFQIAITDEKGAVLGAANPIASPFFSTEQYVDLSQIFNTSIPGGTYPKAYQLKIYGTCRDVLIEDWSIDFDLHPIPLSFLKIQPNNLGSPTKKRFRTWPLIIDTLGRDVIFTPNVDGIDKAPLIFNSNYKKTHFYYFTDDVFGIDYGGTLYDSTGLMEVWSTGVDGQAGSLNSGVVQNLPISTKFDQIGPLEIFRWGKVLRMALRCYSSTTGSIPFKVYMNDKMIYANNFNVIGGVEDEYVVDLPKGTSGHILRVELGPTAFTFNRYFMKFQVAISASQNDTELAWLTVPGLSSTVAQGI